ncbi:MAG: hypothetical protein ABIC95_03170 [archaeon]
MGMTIKVPVSEIGKDTTCKRVREILEKDPENAYTIKGLMVTAFDVNEKDIDGKRFSEWKKGQPQLYAKIKKCLNTLCVEGEIQAEKHGRAVVVHWDKRSASLTMRERLDREEQSRTLL